MAVTAAMLYDMVRCPHRMTEDLFGDPRLRDPVSPLVELLWERGNAYEKEVIERLTQPFLNLRGYTGVEQEQRTLEAMQRREPLIYGGRITAGDLIGEPDLLRFHDTGYVAGDIKSGAGEEGGDEESDAKPKKHYAVQLALYTDILERIGHSAGRYPFVWDVHGKEVIYDLGAPMGPRTPQSLWDVYQEFLSHARAVLEREEKTVPAYGSTCKLCHWHSTCLRSLEGLKDVTLLPEMGRARRDALPANLRTIPGLAQADLAAVGKVKGFSKETLQKFRERAILRTRQDPKPYLREPVVLPEMATELFFDIETDPMRDICYLHGFIERIGGKKGTQRYVPFLAEEPTPEAEERAFAAAWEYICRSQPCAFYYYSAYERTQWRRLQQRYPHVATDDEIEALFAAASTVDLYAIVRAKSEWPTRDFSVKTLASFLGFHWRDTNPSGAASIEWYHRWTETSDQGVRQRILEYNEDDCVAMQVLAEALRHMTVA